MKYKILYACLLVLPFIMEGCTKENLDNTNGEVIKQWTVFIRSKNELPAPANLADTGFVNFQLFSDNSIRYELTMINITANDVLNGAHLSAGDAVTNGNTLLDFTSVSKYPSTIGINTSSYGVYSAVRQTLVDSLLNNSTDLYFELFSVQHKTGYARGQINKRIEFAADVTLTGSEEVPAVNTTATGITWLRLAADKKLYSKIAIVNNVAGDLFTMAHIHRGSVGVNGPILVNLATTSADFGVSKVVDVDQTTYNAIFTDGALYINAHSGLFPTGKIRGQLRK